MRQHFQAGIVALRSAVTQLVIWRRNVSGYAQTLLASLILFTCMADGPRLAAASLQQNDDTNDTSDVWGGQDVRLQITAQGATVEFDCADGKILEPISADAKGEFTAHGTYTPSPRGPMRKNPPPRDISAVYKGTISGDTMHLQLSVENKEIQLPLFTLMKGKDGHLVRCQ